ncbi:MAG: isoprenyl transferase [Muribaculaceae bacterium]|nr:isoprenyl transferase [Muribaculaceae bacterium]MDE6832006.1 isoprenyl transferase [Muribaculaceae bacterium]
MTDYCSTYGIDPIRLPRHIAIIMDGNGRWATARNLPRSEGHVEGVTTVRRITEESSRLGIQYLTLYTFSTENWNRPQDEVDALMHLISIAIERETPDLIKNNVRLTMIGDFDRLPAEPRRRLQSSFDATAHCTGLTLCLALSYSSRWELTRAASLIADDVANGRLSVDDITDEAIASRLTTAPMPDPDLLIRTGGDTRVSNFLLWQIAYTELIFTDTFWPDYSPEEYREAIRKYQTRERRYGLTSAQVN